MIKKFEQYNNGDTYVYTHNRNPRLEVTINVINGRISEIENKNNIRFPYKVGQMFSRNIEVWASNNGYSINGKDMSVKNDKIFGIKKKDIPKGHHLRALYPGKFNESSSNIYNEIYSFCEAKNTFRYSKDGIEQTERLKFLLDLLDRKGLNYELDTFEYDEELFLTNIILKGSSNKWVVAHYDIVNPESDNANDNSCSVINAIALKLKNPSINVALLDGEEPPILGGGSQRLCDNTLGSNVDFVLNLELSGKGGESFFIGNYDTELCDMLVEEFDCPTIDVPFNDAIVFIENGYNSTVINPLPKDDLEKMDLSLLYHCHSVKDSLSTIDTNDMRLFVDNVLMKICR
jgi:hypothetical protein